MRYQIRLCLIILVLFSGCAIPAKHPGLRNASLPELVPRRAFFNAPDATSNYVISPDGKKLAWLGYKRGHWNLFTRDLDQQQTAMIDTGCWCNVQWFKWAQDSRHLFYATHIQGEVDQHIYLADREAPHASSINLTPEAKGLAVFHHQLGESGSQILVTQNKRCEFCFDLYQVDLESRESLPLERSDRRVLQWFSSRNDDLRGRVRIDTDDCFTLDIRHVNGDDNSNAWRTVYRWRMNEDVDVLGFTPDDKGVWLLSNRARDRMALIHLDIHAGTEELVHEDPIADLLSVFIGPQSHRPKTALAMPAYPALHILDETVRKGLERFKLHPHQGIDILSMDDQEKLWTVRVFDDRGAYYFLYDLNNDDITALGEDRVDPENRWAAAMKPVELVSRDGLPLRGYLTRPRGTGNHPLPMVLLVHGGPWSRDYWEYNDMVQFLANRGYAVLQVNFRGSSGYGLAFMEAAIGEFSGKMHTDLIDAAQWAIEQEIADPAAIAIVGGSYGGYSAFVGLTHTPDIFACAVAINGVSDIGLFINDLPSSPPPIRRPGIKTWHTYVSPPDAPLADEIYERVSPLHHAENIRKPVLIIYGERDLRVAPEHSEEMIARLNRLRKPVATLQFQNEGHGISRIDNSCEMFRAIEAFLARHIGGRSAGADKEAL